MKKLVIFASTILITIFFLITLTNVEKNQDSALVGADGSFTQKKDNQDKAPEFPGNAWKATYFTLGKQNFFNGYFVIGNYFPRKETFLLTTFVDYKQVPFKMDGKKTLLFKTMAPKNASKIFKYQTEKITKGNHDIMTILVCKPFDYPYDVAARISSNNMYFIGSRATITYGPKKLQQTKLDNGIAQKLSEPNDFLIINNSAKKLDFLPRDKISEPKTKRYYLHIENPANKIKKVAVIVMLDYKQMPINGKKVLFFSLKPRSVTSYPFQIKSLKKGIHELMALRIDKPFAFDGKIQQDSKIISSIRVALKVE